MKEEPALGARLGFGLQVNQHDVANLCGLTSVPLWAGVIPGKSTGIPGASVLGHPSCCERSSKAGMGNGRYLRSLGWYSHFGREVKEVLRVIGDLKGLTG